ncbi:hypothetical protein C7M84_018224 [Penaeus vannamei]|uniref:Uncharacterized protein n=1 Tax=Penaeus vannamei TaxID=6689 RepID=A0A423SI67_PENVA|nr:hypothetical protein C7M84_018224 [Penaeus vannamei]
MNAGINQGNISAELAKTWRRTVSEAKSSVLKTLSFAAFLTVVVAADPTAESRSRRRLYAGRPFPSASPSTGPQSCPAFGDGSRRGRGFLAAGGHARSAAPVREGAGGEAQPAGGPRTAAQGPARSRRRARRGLATRPPAAEGAPPIVVGAGPQPPRPRPGPALGRPPGKNGPSVGDPGRAAPVPYAAAHGPRGRRGRRGKAQPAPARGRRGRLTGSRGSPPVVVGAGPQPPRPRPGPALARPAGARPRRGCGRATPESHATALGPRGRQGPMGAERPRWAGRRAARPLRPGGGTGERTEGRRAAAAAATQQAKGGARLRRPALPARPAARPTAAPHPTASPIVGGAGPQPTRPETGPSIRPAGAEPGDARGDCPAGRS